MVPSGCEWLSELQIVGFPRGTYLHVAELAKWMLSAVHHAMVYHWYIPSMHPNILTATSITSEPQYS